MAHDPARRGDPAEDGMHRGTPGPAANSGQRQRKLDPRSEVAREFRPGSKWDVGTGDPCDSIKTEDHGAGRVYGDDGGQP